VSGPDPRELAARLPSGFRLGVSTSAAQVEGAEGRGPSGWDAFAERAGAIVDGTNFRRAADSFRRWREDVALIADAGFDAYRFSIAWPRVQPDGRGPLAAPGLDYYERLLDALLAADIRPMATLYHWDTPLPLEESGGWTSRATAERFGEYAGLVAERLADRVADWVTINEPATVTLNGYALGIHAPGRADLFRAIPAARHQLLAHGLGVQALRAAGVDGRRGRVGIVNVHSPVRPADPARRADRRMAALFDLVHNRLFADPVLAGRAPRTGGLPLAICLALGAQLRWSAEELRLMSQPLDFYGLNYYFPSRIAAGAGGTSSPDGEAAAMAEVPFHLAEEPGAPVTGFGWPIAPGGLREALAGLVRDYSGLPPVVVTEGGASFPDVTDAEGAIDDGERTEYLAAHLAVAADAASGGIPGLTLEGYCVWSLLDNVEWAAGWTQRFGIVAVDPETGERRPKGSYRFLAAVQAARGR